MRGIHGTKHFFEEAGGAKFEEGVALGGGFAEDNDAEQAGGLFPLDCNGRWIAREFGRKEAIAVEGVVDPGRGVLDGGREEERRGQADMGEAQEALD